MEQQTLATVKETKLSAEELANKQAILAQYAQVSEGDEYPLVCMAVVNHQRPSTRLLLAGSREACPLTV